MDTDLLIAGIAALCLLVFLIYSMLHPEIF